MLSKILSSFTQSKYFYKSQRDWINDDSPLKICVKSRQTGFSYCNCFRLVLLVSAKDARHDAYISSRDQHQARLQLEDCLHWAKVLNLGSRNLGEVMIDQSSNLSAYTLEFANGKRIYSLSSNPNALAGKRGHVTLDEFALHQDQRQLYRVAKPVTMWGGQLSIISTHRGVNTLFNELIRSVSERGNRMGWSLHTVPIQKAVEEGIVERINKKTGRNESREAFLARLESECIDEEQWKQEFCCTPADENCAFFSYDLLDACTDDHLKLMTFEQIRAAVFDPEAGEISPTASSCSPRSRLFLGADIARRRNLFVMDVGEEIGSIVYDRCRIELHNKPFHEIKAALWPFLRLPQLKYACIDETGLGIQLAEEAKMDFGWKVEPVNFTAAIKEQMAFALRRDFEDCNLRIPRDEALRLDLRGLRKEVTPSGKIRFIGEKHDMSCDRTWAKALRQYAARPRATIGAMVG